MHAQLALFAEPAQQAVTPQATTTPAHTHRISIRSLTALRALSIAEKTTTLTLPLMDTATYSSVAEILEACGIVWHRQRKTHVGSPAAFDELRRAIASGTYYDSRRALEFFATSKNTAYYLAAELADKIDSMDEPRVLEPSAGHGALIDAVLAAVPHASVTALELDPRRLAFLQDKYANDKRVTVLHTDVLDFHETEWDGIIVNPPFEYGHAHVAHITPLTRPHGAIVGVAMIARKKDADLAQFLHDHDADLWETEGKPFEGTPTQATCFSFRNAPSRLDRLRAILQEHHPSLVFAIPQLCELSRDFHRLITDECNGDVPAAQYHEGLKRILGAAHALVQPENVKIAPIWDPRGCCGFTLALPSGITNDFGRTGIMVPDALPRKAS